MEPFKDLESTKKISSNQDLHFVWVVLVLFSQKVFWNNLDQNLESFSSTLPWIFGQKCFNFKYIDLETGKSECFDKLLTDHEDIELGRCVWRLTGMPCTKASDADRYYFYQDYKKIDKEKKTGHGYNR